MRPSEEAVAAAALPEGRFWALPFEKYGKSLDQLLDWVMQNVAFALPDPQKITSIIIFGEIYGPGMQDLHYGSKEKDWRVFDVAINGEYVSWSALEFFKEKFGLPLVPELALGIFNFDQLVEMAQGDSILAPGQIKEGIVIRPMMEETWLQGDRDPNPKRRIFKLISDNYLLLKGGTENH